MADGFFFANDPDLSKIKSQKALAQALMQQGMGDAGSAPYGGIANALKEVAGAYLNSRSDKANSANYTKQLAALLGQEQPNTVQVTPQIQADASGAPQPNDPSLYNQPASTFQGGQLGMAPDKAKLLASVLQGVDPDQGRQALQGIAMDQLTPKPPIMLGKDQIPLDPNTYKPLPGFEDRLSGGGDLHYEKSGDTVLVYRGDKLLRSDRADQYHVIAPNGTIAKIDGTGGPIVPAAPQQPASAPAAASPSPSESDVQGLLQKAIPGVRITSGYRTPQHNAEIGGAPNSYHTRGDGQAVDLVLPPNVSFDQFKAFVQQSGLPVRELLNEKAGDAHSTGNHVHLAWGGSAQPAQAGAQPAQAPQGGGAVHPVYTAPPAPVAPTAALMTPEAIDLAANRALAGDRTALQGFGYGQAGAAARAAVQNRIATLAKERGITGPRLAETMATFNKATGGFATGVQGNTTRSISVALDHMDTLSHLSDALKNGDVKLLNSISQSFRDQFGQPAPTNFDAAKQIIGDEIVKAIVGTGGAQADREKAAEAISRANSPAQLSGVIDTYRKLLTGQLRGLRQQYEQGTGLKDFEDKLSPAARRLLHPAPQSNAPMKVGRFVVTPG